MGVGPAIRKMEIEVDRVALGGKPRGHLKIVLQAVDTVRRVDPDSEPDSGHTATAENVFKRSSGVVVRSVLVSEPSS